MTNNCLSCANFVPLDSSGLGTCCNQNVNAMLVRFLSPSLSHDPLAVQDVSERSIHILVNGSYNRCDHYLKSEDYAINREAEVVR